MCATGRPVVRAEPFTPNEFAAATGVSRETLARLKAYVSLLEDWNARHNLVSAASLADVWRRHVWDSAQLFPLIPVEARSLVDLGSGAGFPGLVLAAMARERTGFRTVLYESIGKKCRFLEAAAERMDLPVEVRNVRMEEVVPEAFDVVTARACAPLAKLLAYAQPFQGPATVNLFLKGQSVEVELTEAHKSWRMKLARSESRTDPSGVILEIRELRHVGFARSR
ncbi:MAG: 16S rRNA (guanine(527)-N(7))-methyltransferase RsmG [Alphaproteobacteria bacterium]|nr:16S rRNA (guanine(527)-N(7))-methyltransferase RsmG [Alphaproteobacteria bacterium]